MSAELPLDKMTFADKLEAMEFLWSDLSKDPARSPEWHRDILHERRRLLAEGKLKF